MLAAAAAHASAVHGWRAGRFGLAAAAAVVAGGVLVHLPSLAYHAEHGDNARVTTRRVLDVEGHGLRLVTLAMPHTEHRSRLLADVRWRFSAMRFDHQSENDYSGLGLAPAAGLGACLLAVLFPHRRTAGLVVAGRLCLAVVLVGTVGGLCSAIGEAGFTQVRAYARAVIYLGLFGAVAAAGLVDRVGGRWRWPAAALLVAFGVWDQTPRRWFTGRAGEVRQAHARGYREDAAFYAAVEAQHPGAVVFCLPFAPWPEDRHEHVRPSLHTRTWRYSYGAVRYREADDWQRRVAARPADEFLRRACVRGFDAVIYRRDIPLDYHHPSPSLDDLLAELGPDTPQWEHPDWNSVYLDLRPYRNKLRDAVGAAEFDRQAREEAEAVSALWLSGSDCYAWSGHEDDARWLNRRAKLMLVNPTDRSRRVTVRATVGGLAPGLVYADLSAAGPVWAGHWPGATTGTRIESTFDLPPGRHPVVLTTRPGPPFGGYRVPQGRVVDPKLLIELTDWTLVHSD